MTADACPRCAAPLRTEQAWCLSCGAAARTRLAAARSWRVPLALLAAAAAIAFVGLVVAFARLTDDASSPPAGGSTTAPAATTGG